VFGWPFHNPERAPIKAKSN